jgi:hypothetical protein
MRCTTTRNARSTKFFYDSATFEVMPHLPPAAGAHLLVTSSELPRRFAVAGFHVRVREEGIASGRPYG